MPLQKSFIPHGSWWSTPFFRWQGGLSSLHSIELAARTASRFLKERSIPAEALDRLVLGFTVPQKQSFYGAPWMAGMIGAHGISGPNVSQACATSARVLATAALEVEAGLSSCVLAVTCDRTSNGAHVYFPNPGGTGGMGETEDVVWDNFNRDPNTGHAMVRTAENVAAAAGISREEQDALTLVRHAQYQEALASDRAFQRRYLFPVEVPKGRKETLLLDADEGVFPTTKEGLAKARPALEGGTVTFGTQTYPADGNAGLMVCSREKARDLARDKTVTVQILGFGGARVEKAHMPKAVVPAARRALEHAGLRVEDLKAIKTHNPFAVNDVLFSREMGVKPEAFNRYGSPLVYGHPQGPTGTRVIAELLEELILAGGGNGLFTGCAAGDTAMAVVVRVG